MTPRIATPGCIWIFHCPPLPDLDEQRRARTRTGHAVGWLNRPFGTGMHRFRVCGFVGAIPVSERTGA